MIQITCIPPTSRRQWGLEPFITALNGAIAINATITCAFVSSSVIRKWNKRYRGKNSATDVLSFGWKTGEGLPFDLSSGALAAEEALAKKGIVGDVLLCKSVLAQEVARSAYTLQQLIQHRFVHGVLHVLGHDHEYQAQARRMENLERRVLGFDPYV